LNISREGDSATSLGSLFQCSVTLRGKKFFPMCRWNFLCFSLCLLPLLNRYLNILGLVLSFGEFRQDKWIEDLTISASYDFAEASYCFYSKIIEKLASKHRLCVGRA